MKILMLGWELPPHNSGGLGVACENMARALSAAGVKIDFVVPYAAEHPGIDFMRIFSATNLDPIFRYGRSAYESMHIDEKTIPTTNGMLSIRDVQHAYINYVDEYLQAHRPDVVHAHDWLTYEAGLLAKERYHIPLIAHVHATEYDRAGGRTGNQLIHDIENKVLNLADRIITVSEATKHLVHSKYGVALDKIDVVYNSLDNSYLHSDYEYHDDTYSYITKLKNQGYTIVSTVGRFTIQKGLGFLMRGAALAIKDNPKLFFIFAGDGEEFGELVSLSAQLGITDHVVFTGFLRGDKLRDIYSLTDIFVMSSVSEPFGLTALEAAHHGDCLILTRQSGVSELIWSALEYDYWDEAKLAREILAISKSPTLQDILKKSIKEECERFSWDDAAEDCLKIYTKCLKKG